MRRILFITLSNIGDALLTTPVLERLHQCFPAARIDIVADPRSCAVFEHCPYRGEILLRHKQEGWRGSVKLLARLRKTRYELVVDLRTDGLSYLLRARRRLTRWGARPLGPHAVQRHMGVVARLTGESVPAPRVWLNGALREEAALRLSSLGPGELLALAPGANWAPKIWPAPQYRQLVNLLRDDFRGVVLLGGAGDRARAESVQAGLDLPALNLAGETTLLEAAAILERVRAFVGNDSGLGHLAAAVNTPTLVVFGPGEPLRYHPWGSHATWIRGEHARLDQLDSAAVATALRKHLARQS